VVGAGEQRGQDTRGVGLDPRRDEKAIADRVTRMVEGCDCARVPGVLPREG
jgi:hypothetical protein